MKKLLKKAFLLATILFVTILNNTANANSIKGAFGYKLGDTVDSIEDKYSRDIFYFLMGIKIPIKSFTPEKPLPFLNEYRILTTPSSKSIFKIMGYKSIKDSKVMNTENCNSFGNSDYSDLIKMLNAKYGTFITQRDLSSRDTGTSKGVSWKSTREVMKFVDGNRTITIECNSNNNPANLSYLLLLAYFDEDIDSIANEEALEIERQKALEQSSEYDI